VVARTSDRTGPDEDFGRAALEHLDALYSFAMVLARNADTARDLVQETYLHAVRARHSFTPGTNLKGWLFVILRNAWITECRRHRAAPDRFALDELEGAGGADAPDALLLRKVVREAVAGAIDGLADEHREIVVLRDVEGFSYREISAILGCPIGTVMSRLSRARACLRRSLGGAFSPWATSSERER
jgi:RNA polymerase sigma-70 factor, ECF subfamily